MINRYLKKPWFIFFSDRDADLINFINKIINKISKVIYIYLFRTYLGSRLLPKID
jgi:hypothetical protein